MTFRIFLSGLLVVISNNRGLCLTQEEAFLQLMSKPGIDQKALSSYMPDIFDYSEDDNKINFKCDDLLTVPSDVHPIGERLPPPAEIPEKYRKAFTLDGLIPVAYNYFNDMTESEHSIIDWSDDLFEELRKNSKFESCGPYLTHVCEQAAAAYAGNFIRGKRGLVVGSLTPWAEVGLFNHGASEIITSEYNKIISNHTNLTVVTPMELNELYSSGRWDPVDFIFSFSSLEHDGLGRYGDPINPWGDLETMCKLHCLLKSDGLMFFGVPTGSDMLGWNSHRVYGKIRLSILFQKWWKILDFFSGEYEEITLLPVGDDVAHGTVLRYVESMWVLQKINM